MQATAISDPSLEPAIVTQCADIACHSHLRALRLGGNPHLSDTFVRALIRAVDSRCTNANLEMISLGHFPPEDHKLLKVLESTIDQAARKKALSEQNGKKIRRIDPKSHVAQAQVGNAAATAAATAAAAAAAAATAAAAARQRATPRMSNAMRSWRKTPASAAVSPPLTAPRGKNGKCPRPSVTARTAGTEPASPWPLPPQVLRPSPQPAPRRIQEVHLVSLSRLSPAAHTQLAGIVSMYF